MPQFQVNSNAGNFEKVLCSNSSTHVMDLFHSLRFIVLHLKNKPKMLEGSITALMSPHVRLSVGRSIRHYFQEGPEVTLPCSHHMTCYSEVSILLFYNFSKEKAFRQHCSCCSLPGCLGWTRLEVESWLVTRLVGDQKIRLVVNKMLG